MLNRIENSFGKTPDYSKGASNTQDIIMAMSKQIWSLKIADVDELNW